MPPTIVTIAKLQNYMVNELSHMECSKVLNETKKNCVNDSPTNWKFATRRRNIPLHPTKPGFSIFRLPLKLAISELTEELRLRTRKFNCLASRPAEA